MLGITLEDDTGGEVPLDGAPPPAPVVVGSVLPGSTAAHCGIRVHDVLLRIDAQPIPSFAALRQVLAHHQVGDHVRILVRRDGQELLLQAVLRGPPPPPGEGGIIP